MAGVKGRSGGARVGGGRKPLSGSARWLHGGTRKAQTERTPAAAIVPLEAPDDLPADQRPIWAALAPHAMAAATLNMQTAAAFGELVELVAVKRLMLAQIRTDGLTVDGGAAAHPLLNRWTALVVRVDAGMARFCLTANGKPMPATAKGRPDDDFSEFDREFDGPTLVRPSERNG